MILIKNIYYMLAYAFYILEKQGYEKCSTEDFENASDLLCAILINGITIQLKQSINRSLWDKTKKYPAYAEK